MSAPSAANSSTPAGDPLKSAGVSSPASSGVKSGDEPEVHDDDDDDEEEKKKEQEVVDYPNKKLKDSHSGQFPAVTTSSQSAPSSAGGSQTAPSSAAAGGLDSIQTGLAMVLVSASDRFKVAGPAGSSDDESGSDSGSGSDFDDGASIESPPVSGASGLTTSATRISIHES